jgi:hypothetical protein
MKRPLTEREREQVNEWFFRFEDRLDALEELTTSVDVDALARLPDALAELEQRVAAIEEAFARRSAEETGKRGG